MQSLGTIHYGKQKCIEGLTAIELTGADRVGLLSEVFAVLSNFKCNVVEANVWTHNGRVASLIYIKDIDSGSSTEDSNKVDRMEEMLRNVLKGDNDIRSARTLVSMAVTHTERRLHQMMSADGDYERKPIIKTSGDRPVVEVQDSLEKGYSVVHVQCKDRTKLMFDVVCALTDIQYVVFHATVDTSGHRASLVYVVLFVHLVLFNPEYRSLWFALGFYRYVICYKFFFRNFSLGTQMEPQLLQKQKRNM